MKYLKALDYLYNNRFEIPVFKEMESNEDQDPSKTPKKETINLRSFAIVTKIQLQSYDKHMKILMEAMKELDAVGVTTKSLEKYRLIHMNDLYEYAKWKPLEENEFLNKSRESEV